MDLYNKQRVESGRKPVSSKRASDVISEPKHDAIPASRPERMDEQVDQNMEEVDEPIPAPDTEMVDAPNPNPDTEIVEADSAPVPQEEKMDDVVLPSSPELQSRDPVCIPKLEVPAEDNVLDNLAEPQAVSGVVKVEASSLDPAAKLEDLSADDGFESLNDLPGDDDLVGICKTDDLVGSLKDYEVMSESNDYESVNLSRIHHSPESTH